MATHLLAFSSTIDFFLGEQIRVPIGLKHHIGRERCRNHDQSGCRCPVILYPPIRLSGDEQVYPLGWNKPV